MKVSIVINLNRIISQMCGNVFVYDALRCLRLIQQNRNAERLREALRSLGEGWALESARAVAPLFIVIIRLKVVICRKLNSNNQLALAMRYMRCCNAFNISPICLHSDSNHIFYDLPM